MNFKEFDVSKFKNTMKKYADEAETLYGNTTYYKEFESKTANYSDQDWYRINDEADVILLEEFSNLMDKGPGSAEAQAQVQKWKDFITNNWYNCTDEILLCFKNLYLSYEFKKYFDKYKEGLAEFISQAIEIYFNSKASQ